MIEIIKFEAKAKNMGTSCGVIIPAYLVHKHGLRNQIVEVIIKKPQNDM